MEVHIGTSGWAYAWNRGGSLAWFVEHSGLNAVEHPTYDVWLTDCKGGTSPNVAEAGEGQAGRKPPEAAAPASRTPQPRPAPRQQ